MDNPTTGAIPREQGELGDEELDPEVAGETGLDLDVEESPLERYRRLHRHEAGLQAAVSALHEQFEILHGQLDATREAKRRAMTAIEEAIVTTSTDDDLKPALDKIQASREW
jgi:hypothetical protein